MSEETEKTTPEEQKPLAPKPAAKKPAPPKAPFNPFAKKSTPFNSSKSGNPSNRGKSFKGGGVKKGK